jgi:hypothetical protein
LKRREPQAFMSTHSTHKFAVGDYVILSANVLRLRAAGLFKIVRLLPGETEALYRIKAPDEPFERVAAEHQLDRAAPGAAPIEGSAAASPEESPAKSRIRLVSPRPRQPPRSPEAGQAAAVRTRT